MNRNLILFLTGWVVLALVQATFTDLANDEAYYWVYSLKPEWGYFDHPPVVALFIKAGYILFQNELGVRLVTILSQVLALYLTFTFLIPFGNQNLKKYIWLVILIPLIHVYSFIAVPDPPLFLGTVIFLVLYKKFLEDSTWTIVPVLAVTMAFMMYSKYHAALVILLVMASRPKLFLDVRFLTACISGAVLFLPHLWWQYVHEFPSFKYHLVDRNTEFDIRDVGMYLINQLINFNPVLFPLVLFRAIKSKPSEDSLERAMRFLLFGFLLFFLLMTWRGHIEPQWTYIVSIPVLYFGVRLISDYDFRWIKRSAILILPLLIAGRFFLIFDILPIATEFHGYPELIEKIKSEASGLPVVILNSYQLTSKYHFYGEEKPYAMITDGRRNQYSLSPDEEEILGSKVLLVSRREAEGFSKTFSSGLYKVWTKPVDNFSYFKSAVISSLEIINVSKAETRFSISLKNPYRKEIILDSSRELVLIILDKKGKAGTMIPLKSELKTIHPESEVSSEVSCNLSDVSSPTQAIIGIRSNNQFFSFNSKPILIQKINE